MGVKFKQRYCGLYVDVFSNVSCVKALVIINNFKEKLEYKITVLLYTVSSKCVYVSVCV